MSTGVLPLNLCRPVLDNRGELVQSCATPPLARAVSVFRAASGLGKSLTLPDGPDAGSKPRTVLRQVQ